MNIDVVGSKIMQLIDDYKLGEAKKSIQFLLPEDIAALVKNIEDPYQRVLLFRLITPQKAIEVFEHLEPENEREVLIALSDERVKEIINNMAPDERTELFEDIPPGLVKRLLNFLSPDKRKVAIDLLGYPEDSVGRLMTPEFLQLYESITVAEALQHIRKVGLNTETIYHCYVLDSQKKLTGVVSLKKLVLASPGTKIKELIDNNKKIIKVNVYTDREEAAKIFRKYDLIALPVVNKREEFLGIVTFDDFVDVIDDEATEDFEKIAAVLPVDKPYMDAGFFEIVWKRSFWLIVLLIFESLSIFVLQNYSASISRMVALTFFLPILIAAGGNAGTQSATVVIRGLAMGQIQISRFFRVVFREASLGILIGFILAVCGILRAFLQQGDWWLSLSVGISMGLTIVLSTTVGALLPLIFKKMNWDPALMSAPLIATIVDVVGIAIYFEIANILLGLG